jgi:2-keto-4-pentenoate hydratase
MFDPATLAQEFISGRSTAQTLIPPSEREPEFDLTAAYAVEAAIVESRRDAGHTPVGYKVGYANKAMWRALGLETLVWAHMYDDTVKCADRNAAQLTVPDVNAPKIEPEIVFKLKRPLPAERVDAATVMDAVEWIALGFELIDSPFGDSKFTPSDFVAAFGFHVALVVGDPYPIDRANGATLIDQLSRFTVSLMKNGQVASTGGGRNVLRSPALSLGELASAMSRHGVSSLAAGDLVSTGTLTESQRIAAGETWTASVEGIDLAPLTISFR